MARPVAQASREFEGHRCFQTLLAVLAVSIALAHSALAADLPRPKNILLLYSFSERGVWDSVDSLESAVRAHVAGPVNFDVEYLETQRFEDETYERTFAETVREEFGGQKLDLIIAAAYPALRFALRHRDTWSPGVPIVFSYVHPGRLTGHEMWPGVTGVTLTVDAGSTIGLALRLHPNANAIAVITDNTEFGRYWLSAIHAELLRRQDRVKEIDLVGLAAGQLLERVAALGQQTIALFSVIPEESIQPAMGVYGELETVGLRLPTYCFFPKLCLNHGGIGGADYDEKEQTALTAALAARVLAGERPENIPVVHGSSSHIRVDWRQLRRWGIPDSALAPGTQILYREPTPWERYWKYIAAAIALIILQALLIAGLLRQRARNRKAETVLRESEERFRKMADTTPSLVWMCDEKGQVTYLNERRVAFTGRDPDAGYRDTWTKYVHPEDVKTVVAAQMQGLERQKAFSLEYRLRRRDGVYRWMFDVAAPRVNADGSFAGFIGSAIDITDQKLAQEALANISGRLIEAQEKERGRIARELHDDIVQRLTLLSMEIDQANGNFSRSAIGSKELAIDIRQHCSEIARDVQALSHQLHSSKLDYLGLVAGTRAFCDEFGNQRQVDIEFTAENVPKTLPKDVALCLFRVMQEGLQNAVKYSGTTQFEVHLQGTGESVQLEVKDAGAGFEVEEAKRGTGLGLVSMRERVHVLHGWFHVESSPGAGARIVAAVPLVAANDGLPAEMRRQEVAP